MGKSKKQRAWELFDRIIDKAMASPTFTGGPWDGGGRYVPDIHTLELLLGVPLLIEANSQSGAPALALDAWTAYELRRAGFDHDAVWPRHQHPRVLPKPVANYQRAAAKNIRSTVEKQIQQETPIAGVAATDARVLGRHYVKQVDVVMSAWETGPEILISTKRMDSSFGKNAANRIEEAYGDAKNLRSRHPLAAHGFLYGLRSTILDREPDKALWLIDLLGKLAQEDDAYDTVCLLMIDYDAEPPTDADGGHIDEEDGAALELTTQAAGDVEDETDDAEDATSEAALDADIARLPAVKVIEHESIPDSLTAARFFQNIVEHVLNATPVTMHTEARKLRGLPAAGAK